MIPELCEVMSMGVRVPIGIDSFEKLRSDGYYYIDKTGFIEELLQKSFEVNLITRPRRFGKTLAMSTLASFFDIRKNNADLFTGLRVSRNSALCRKWQNQWPVLFLTLKGVEGLNFTNAYAMLSAVISDLCIAHYYLLDSNRVNEIDKTVFERLAKKNAPLEEIKNSIYTLMRMMHAHFGKTVILLVDEYDVPLAKASELAYYDQMLDVIRGLLGKTLKTNEFLKFAVVTGCLKIAQESIFTGTNNFASDSISGERFGEYFGFTTNEVKKLLTDVNLTNHAEEIKCWYDGYRFGSIDIYCPWDVLNHVNKLQDTPTAKPENYWKNTSHNGIIRSFINRTDLAVNEKFEILLSGGSIKERICETLTYDTLHSSESNLWSVLYLTGYLTMAKSTTEEYVDLKIPNEEIRSIFADTVSNWFQDRVTKLNRTKLFDAFWNGDAAAITEQISSLLFDTISYHDYKESYYHAFTAGLFAGAGYIVESNYEYGLGRPDIVVKDRENRRVIILEIKHSQNEQRLKNDCLKALQQIEAHEYATKFLKGYRNIICYGIAFYEKECLVIKK